MAQHATTGRLEAGDFSLHEIGSEFAKGLGIVTQAIHDAEVETTTAVNLATAYKEHTGTERDLTALSTRELNQCLAALVRDRCVCEGWIAGWVCLVKAAPNVGLHPRLVEDVEMAAGVYGRLSKGTRRVEPIDVFMSIGPDASYDDLQTVGPKSLGGRAWKASREYAEVLSRQTWRDPGYSEGFSPCVAYGWIAVQIKVIPPADSPDAMRLQLLNIVDYDLDKGEDNNRGFENGFQMGAKHAITPGTKLQGAAFTGMISYDFQCFVRNIQQGWVAQKDGAFNLGPAEASPEEWAAVQVGDCAALVPFAFETPGVYNMSRTGMITGMIQLQCHDLLFDAGCSNRITTIQYTAAAGVGTYGIHAGFAIGYFEAIASFFLSALNSSETDSVTPPYGFVACMVAGPWNPFNTRYRAWERCIKYTRQLVKSQSPIAAETLRLARADLVLKDCDINVDAGAAWARAMKSGPEDLIPRTAVSYHIPSIAGELLTTPGVIPPELCTKCGPAFEAMMHEPGATEEVRAIQGLPESVTMCRSAGLAAGIRRAALWASEEKNCCEACAGRIGSWTDATAYSVLSALMSCEPITGPSTWSLQNYFVGAVTFWPMEMPFLLSGFDLLARMSFEDGAMGHRDIVDI